MIYFLRLLVAVIIGLLILLAISACGKKEEPPTYKGPITAEPEGVRILNSRNIFRDEATGCEYVSNGTGITPRLNNLGSPICGKH